MSVYKKFMTTNHPDLFFVDEFLSYHGNKRCTYCDSTDTFTTFPFVNDGWSDLLQCNSCKFFSVIGYCDPMGREGRPLPAMIIYLYAPENIYFNRETK